LDLVKKRDYEHFLATLLLPKEVRRAAVALRAFNVEIASVRDSVTDQVSTCLKYIVATHSGKSALRSSGRVQ